MIVMPECCPICGEKLDLWTDPQPFYVHCEFGATREIWLDIMRHLEEPESSLDYCCDPGTICVKRVPG